MPSMGSFRVLFISMVNIRKNLGNLMGKLIQILKLFSRIFLNTQIGCLMIVNVDYIYARYKIIWCIDGDFEDFRKLAVEDSICVC